MVLNTLFLPLECQGFLFPRTLPKLAQIFHVVVSLPGVRLEPNNRDALAAYIDHVFPREGGKVIFLF